MSGVLINQVFQGGCSFVAGNKPIIIDSRNQIIYSEGANINQLQVRTLEPKGPFLDILVDTELVFNEFGVKWSNAGNESEIYQNGTDLFIESTGNVVINNLVVPNIPNVNGIINDLANLSNDVNALENSVNSLSNSVSNVSNQANSASNLANSAFNLANSYQTSLTTDQLLVSGTNLVYKVNLSSSPQVSFNANGSTLPFISVERNFGGDFTQTIHEPSGLGIIHSYTTIGSDEVPYLTFSDNVIGQTSSIYFGANDPNINLTPDGGSLYLATNGDILMGNGSNWISYLSGINQSNNAFNQANLAFNQANSAFNQANSATVLASNAFNQANIAINGVNALFNFVSNEINTINSQISFRDSQEFYVSADGSDITGTGSILQPFQTIQKAVSDANLIASSSNQITIYVGPGTYTENILITSGYISIIGQTSTAVQSGHYGITGDISLNINSNDLFQNFTILQGLVIRGSVVDNSTGEHSLTLQDCRIVVPNTRSYAVKVQQNTVDKRVRLINCQITENSATAFTDSLVEVQGGWLYLERCDLTTKSVITAVELGTGSYLPRMALCSIECGSASASLPPQIFFNQDVNPPDNTIQSIGQTTIVAPVGGGATGVNGLNTAIHIRTGVATTSFSIYGVICGIANNPFPNDIITNFHGTAVPVIYADFFALPGTAHKFGANLTKLAMTVVN